MADQFDPKTLQEFLNTMNKVNTVMEATLTMMVDKGREFNVMMEEMSSKWRNFGVDAKKAASAAASVKKEFSDVLDLVKNLHDKKPFDNKSLGDVRRELSEIVKNVNKIKDTSLFPKEKQGSLDALKVFKSLLDEISRKTKEAGKSLDSSFDYEIIKKCNKAMENLEVHLSSVHQKLERLRSPLESAGKTFRDLFGDMGGRFTAPLMQAYDRAQAMREKGQYARDIAKRQMATGTEQFKEKVRTGQGRVSGLMREVPLTEDGGIDIEAINAMGLKDRRRLARKARAIGRMGDVDLQGEMGELSGRGGVRGALEARLAGKGVRSLAEALSAEGGEVGVGGITRTVIGGIVRGGGSAAAGGGEMGAAAMGAAAMGAASAPIAAVVGVLALLREGFDAMVESNKDIFAKLGGGGGMFTGGQAPAQAFQAVRANLTPGMNMYGQTYAANLDAAESITKFGVSVADLTDRTNDISKNIIGLAGGRPGQGIATTVYGGARLAGLDVKGATEEIMKLLQQYHESLEGTDTFFNMLNEDTKAAGITSMKYIQILDEISGSFDSMARGVDDVTSSLRMLGHTGLLTSEQVSNSMKTMMNKSTTPEVGAFLAMKMTPESKKSMLAAQKMDVGDQAQRAYDSLVDAFKSAGMTEDQAHQKLGTQGITTETLADINSNAAAKATMVAGRDLTGVGDAVKKQAVGSALENLQAGRNALTSTPNFLRNPTAQNALQFSFQPNIGPAAAVAENTTKLQQALMMAGVGRSPQEVMNTFMLHPERMAAHAMEINKMAETLQLNPEDIPKLRTPVLAAAGAQIAEAQKGTLPEEDYKKIASYVGLAPGATKADVIERLNSSTDEQTKAMEGLAGDWDTFTEMFQRGGPLAKAYADAAKAQGADLRSQAAKDLSAAMTPTGTYLQQIWDVLLHKVFAVLTDIFESIPFHKTAADDAKEATDYEKAHGVTRQMAEDINYMVSGEFGKPGQSTILTDLEKSKNIQANLQKELDKAKATGNKGDVAKLSGLLEAEKNTTAEAERSLDMWRKGKATSLEAESIKGAFRQFQSTQALQAYGAFYHPEQGTPAAAQPGAASQAPGALAVLPEAPRAGNVSVSTITNNAITGLAVAASTTPKAPEQSTEESITDATDTAKAIVDQTMTGNKRTMVQ